MSYLLELSNKTVQEDQTIQYILDEIMLKKKPRKHKNPTKETELNKDIVPEDQGTNSGWQCTENPHTMRLRLQQVNSSA